MNRKILSIFVSITIIILSMAACNSSATPPATENVVPTSPSTPELSPPSSEPEVADSENADMKLGILESQSQREKDIFGDYGNGAYSFAEPYIAQDPYELNPLSALVLFETAPDIFTVTVSGDSDFDTIQYECKIDGIRAEIPVLGLYPGRDNPVEIRNSAGGITNINIKTEPLPETFPTPEVITADVNQMAKGLTFLSSFAQGLYAIDSKGDVRWWISDTASFGYLGPILQLENGRLAILGGKMEAPYYMESIYEIDFLGKVYEDYKIPGNSGHHEICELPNGNLLVAAGAEDRSTDEDHIVEIDRKTGETIKTIDLKICIPMPDYIADPVYVKSRIEDQGQSMEAAEIASRKDWFHNNSFYYDRDDDSLLLSARTLDGLFKIDYSTGELIWVLTDPEATWAQSPGIKEKLLIPADARFEYLYGQHSVQILPSGDILVFDNGCFRSKDWDTIIDDKVNYSRAILLGVNEKDMIVEQTWQYGKERGSKLLSCFVSNIDYIESQHYLINFGGIVFDLDGKNTSDNSIGFRGGSQKTVIIEVKDNQPVFEMELNGGVTPNTYRAYRMSLYANTMV